MGKIKYRTKESLYINTSKPTIDLGAKSIAALPVKFSLFEMIVSRLKGDRDYFITNKTGLRAWLNKWFKNLVFIEDIVSVENNPIINCSGKDIHFRVIAKRDKNGHIYTCVKTSKKSRFKSILELASAHSEGKLVVMNDRYSRGWDKHIGDKYVHIKDFF